MELNNVDQESIRRYLLGPLTADEQQKIEERLMTEDDFFEELEISKDEVLEDYCAGELSAGEREWLEQHFLASAEGRFRRGFALALDQLAVSVPEVVPVTKISERPSLLERFRAFWQSSSWAPAAVAAAVVVVVLAAVGIKYGLFSSKPTTSLAVTLISSPATRAGESQPRQKISISPNIDELTISLALPADGRPGATYRVELDDRSRTTPVEIEGYDNKSVRVKIPAEQLQPGQYVLKLFTRDANGVEQPVPARFFFEVQ
ncbi:MAG TPA: hypothetical protein VFH31_11700 [Pyrinomonadaceae bacterium]|nr:hypothetical protein [Pyrinomonadaceae bacterium]